MHEHTGCSPSMHASYVLAKASPVCCKVGSPCSELSERITKLLCDARYIIKHPLQRKKFPQVFILMLRGLQGPDENK